MDKQELSVASFKFYNHFCLILVIENENKLEIEKNAIPFPLICLHDTLKPNF